MDAAKSADEYISIGALEARRRRVRYRAWHRGTKEMDLMLGPYADAQVAQLDEAGLDRLELLMDELDTDLLKWIIGQEPTPADVDRALLDELIDFRHSKAQAS